MWLKGNLLERGIEPAKIHDLNELDRKLTPRSGLKEEDLLYLTSERSPFFYGAEDLVPDKSYNQEDSDRCLAVLAALGI